MASYELAQAADDPLRYRELFAAVSRDDRDGDPRYGIFGREYYPAVFGDQWNDCSFAVIGSDGSAAVVECGILNGVLSRFGMPIRVLVPVEEMLTTGAARAVVRHLVNVAEHTCSTAVLIDDPGSHTTLGPLGDVCLANDGRLDVRLRAMVDLSKDPAAIRSAVRSRFRSHVNWGERSLELDYCNRANPDRALFERYEALHAIAAGRRTRPDASWQGMFEAIQKGIAELSVAQLDGEPVGAVLVVDGSSTSYYASAAFVRERFDHPLGHWPMMDAILRSRDRGQRRFEIGELPYRADVTDKEHSIGFFKRGFAERIEVRPVWQLDIHVQ